MLETAELGIQVDGVYIPPLPCHLLCDLEQINWTLETQFPHLSMEIVLSHRAMVRTKWGQVLPDT